MLKEADDLASDLLAITDKGLKYCKKLRYLATDDVPYCSLCPLSSPSASPLCFFSDQKEGWFVICYLPLYFEFFRTFIYGILKILTFDGIRLQLQGLFTVRISVENDAMHVFYVDHLFNLQLLLFLYALMIIIIYKSLWKFVSFYGV